eukprot:1438177-Rhodomonas_salina.1
MSCPHRHFRQPKRALADSLETGAILTSSAQRGGGLWSKLVPDARNASTSGSSLTSCVAHSLLGIMRDRSIRPSPSELLSGEVCPNEPEIRPACEEVSILVTCTR